MDWNTPSFKALQNKWYQKLKEEGFKEIEDTDSPKEFLKSWHSHYFFHRYSADEIQEGQDYFRMCDDFYWRYASFKNKTEKEIWRLHSEGYSRRKIAILLLQQKKQISDSSVQIILSKLKKIMHTQTWPVGDSAGADNRSDDYQDEPYNLPNLRRK